MTGKKPTRASFGNIRKLPSGRYQARYTGPDGKKYPARTLDGRPLTFDTKRAAGVWLARKCAQIHADEWTTPAAAKAGPLLFREYALAWLADREVGGEPLALRTRKLYTGLLEGHIFPTFGDQTLSAIDPPMVKTWNKSLALRTGRTRRAHAYALLHAILRTAVEDDELIPVNPCKIRRGGQTRRQSAETEIATVQEIETIAAAMPRRYQLLVLLAAWCTPRFGEVSELRRHDVDVPKLLLRIRRAVVYTSETGRVIKPPKSDAGIRTVAIPPHLMPAVEAHLRDFVEEGGDALLFRGVAGGHLPESTLRDHWAKARLAANRPDLKFHDLRHTAGTLASQVGGSMKEVMVRMGHSTMTSALRYQHGAQGRDAEIAAGLSEIAVAGTVTSIAQASSAKEKKRGKRSA